MCASLCMQLLYMYMYLKKNILQTQSAINHILISINQGSKTAKLNYQIGITDISVHFTLHCVISLLNNTTDVQMFLGFENNVAENDKFSVLPQLHLLNSHVQNTQIFEPSIIQRFTYFTSSCSHLHYTVPPASNKYPTQSIRERTPFARSQSQLTNSALKSKLSK